MKTIDTKVLYEVLPDLPTRKCHSTCKMCNKKMQVLGELISIAWNDYLDGSGEMIDLCESCARFVIGQIRNLT
jgi:hypothetical protein